ncbi:cob(I)yrinic acid a,c-diamide adenosyltransferase [Brevibacillus laterosporus]|uniref:cob(I)yrinic acid a,c-diamide adenosyltransferase n=1 Tax=Brevibacillus laterosporus TaxID=1465 RepID=UPI00037331A4|nr:cob(I)yrinic acid a,c-diamide adenosyltransferase [Brevibacillus laterosporus]ATO50516.1 cob(I)yrinic acid a,c-diamide adenosyltransferase [Brevibacillus laterosporus DSM 25]MBG9802590.1 cobinamide adenolsyltransferase [Brevibacillus laterosporus]MED2005143.1 cob(I)yrinic acid a,c-diamide adenosyltransferase [Brevibacillus laterosporus]MED4766080.1 cob(I)yrinic acid a,c-diamide adenosyltransferase [Brevibacillus laterosporus]TPH20411.1 cob(I)yrinic acid a,c-diamide adenosyltransferase [Brev
MSHRNDVNQEQAYSQEQNVNGAATVVPVESLDELQQKDSPKERVERRGLFLMYTGDGKGKTTAALGVSLRALGRGMNVTFLQFIKSPQRSYGESLSMRKLGMEMQQLGIGFTWTKTPEEHREALKKAWSLTKEKLSDPTIDLLVLDELNNALAISTFPIEDVLPLTEVVEAIKNRPTNMHLVITGRSAKTELIELADLVSTIEPSKHYYNEGIPAVKGLEF